MAIVGTEWLIDASGCRAEALRDVRLLGELFDRIIAELDLHVIGVPVWHEFPQPCGVTGIALLTESHLTCHTYPEHKLATINLYCCRALCMWPWNERLRELLGAKSVSVRVMERGGATTLEQSAAMKDDAAVLRNSVGGRRV